MIASITKNKLLIKIIKAILVLAICLAAWEIFALIKDNEFVLPRVKTTLIALVKIIGSKGFVTIVFTTIFRVLSGLILGTVFGVILATICHFVPAVNLLFSPILSIVKATPVASFIVLLWLTLSGTSLPVLIAFLMVLPIVWQNVLDAYSSLPRKMIEVTEIYAVSIKKRLKYFYLPHLYRFLAPAFITSIGLAWKSEIATEIIAYTKDSIGQQINNHKQYTETPEVFAWTIIIVVLSIVFETATKYLLRRYEK